MERNWFERRTLASAVWSSWVTRAAIRSAMPRLFAAGLLRYSHRCFQPRSSESAFRIVNSSTSSCIYSLANYWCGKSIVWPERWMNPFVLSAIENRQWFGNGREETRFDRWYRIQERSFLLSIATRCSHSKWHFVSRQSRSNHRTSRFVGLRKIDLHSTVTTVLRSGCRFRPHRWPIGGRFQLEMVAPTHRCRQSRTDPVPSDDQRKYSFRSRIGHWWRNSWSGKDGECPRFHLELTGCKWTLDEENRRFWPMCSRNTRLKSVSGALNYPVDKSNESVGEKIRSNFAHESILAIARALVRDPKILLLDEGKYWPMDFRSF